MNAISAGTKEAKHKTTRQIQTTKPKKCFNNDSFRVGPIHFHRTQYSDCYFIIKKITPLLSPPVLVAVIIPDLSSQAAITLNILQCCDHLVSFLCCSPEHVYAPIQTSIHPWCMDSHLNCLQWLSICKTSEGKWSRECEKDVFVKVGIKFRQLPDAPQWFPMRGAYLQLESTSQSRVTQ